MNKSFWSWWWIKDIMRNIIVSIWCRLKLQCYCKPQWRKRNKNNLTELNCLISTKIMDKIKIWNYTYGYMNIDMNDFEKSYIRIWNYCSIAPDVKFICWKDHVSSHITTYPIGFCWFQKKYTKFMNNVLKISDNPRKILKIESEDKWPIIIDDDVWIWTWTKIMSNVHIWQWAIIAAWAVVTKDIPPYAIAWWVPAKVIKYRFSEDIIKKLLQIDYSNIPIEKLRELYPETIKDDFDVNLFV